MHLLPTIDSRRVCMHLQHQELIGVLAYESLARSSEWYQLGNKAYTF